MKKSVFFPLALVLCFSPGLAFGQTGQVKVRVGVAVVRVKPDTASAVLLEVNQGTVLDIVQKAGDWYEVKIPRGSGTVASGFIRSDLVDPVVPPPSPAPRPAIEAKPVASPPPPSQPSGVEQSRRRWGFRLGGGWSRVSLGDINDKRTTDSDFWRFIAAQYNETFSGEFENFHGSLDLEGALTFDVTSRLSLSLGAGFIQARAGKDMGTVINQTSSYSNARDEEERSRAIPVKLGLGYSYRLGSRLEGYVRASVGYYFVHWTEDWHSAFSGTVDVIEQTTAHGSGPGFDGAVGITFKLTPTLSLFMEGGGRYAKIGGLEGEFDYRSISDNYTSHTSGTFYYYELYSTDRKIWNPYVFVFAGPPVGDSYRNIREANLDFSGFSIRAGLAFRLF
jgi:hypothetical protein